MQEKPTYEDLQKRIDELEQQVDQYQTAATSCPPLVQALPHGANLSDKQGNTIDFPHCTIAETPIAKSEEKFRWITENMTDCVALVDAHGTYEYVTPSYKETLGYEQAEMIGISGFDITHPEDLERILNLYVEGHKQHKRELRYETRLRHKEGHYVPIEIRVRPVNDPQGKIVGGVISARDITERKQAEEAIKRHQSMQGKMVANIGDVIVIIDGQGINRYKSTNIEKIFGWKPEEVVGANTWDNIHPEDLEHTQEFFRKIVRKPNAVGTMECRYRCKDGSYRWIELTGTNLLHDPDINGVLGSYRDITERKQAEKSLVESEARFKALHNASFGGITIHDKGTILDCNKGLSNISGYSVSDLIGMDGLMLIAEKSRSEVMGNILSGYEKPYEVYGLRKNGEEYPLRLEARNIPYKERNARVVEFRDISERKLAEEERERLLTQLTQAQKMESVGRLAGGVAHDFNNMLSVILGHTEMAMDSLDSSNPLHEDLKEIRNAAKRSADLTRQLLAFARKQTIAPRLLNLNITVEGMLKMLRRLIGEDIDLAWLPGKNLPQVKMDPSQIDQILANLCVNARDAINGAGEVTIETSQVTLDESYCENHSEAVPGKYILLVISPESVS